MLFFVLSLIVVVAILELTNTTYIFHHKSLVTPKHPTGNAQTKGETSKPANKDTATETDSSNVSGGTDTKQPTTDTTASATLLAPDGVFASSHHVLPNSTIQSTCTTTPGATCEIILTKDGITKTVGSQQTDKGGGAYWTWQPKDIGLTAGSWTITAKAQLGSQTKQSPDALKLEVSP